MSRLGRWILGRSLLGNIWLAGEDAGMGRGWIRCWRLTWGWGRTSAFLGDAKIGQTPSFARAAKLGAVPILLARRLRLFCGGWGDFGYFASGLFVGFGANGAGNFEAGFG